MTTTSTHDAPKALVSGETLTPAAPKARRRPSQVLAPIAVLVVLGVAWQALARLRHIDPIVLPAHALGHTASIVIAGIAIAAALGIAIAILLHWSPALRRGLEPLLVGSQAIPIPILAPLLVIWLGFGLAPQLVLVVIVAFFPVAVATRDALAGLSPETDLVLRNLGATRRQRISLVELRGALPGIVTGLRLAVVFAVIGAVFADSSGATATTAADPTSSAGLGRVVQDAIPQLQTARAFAAIVLLAALALTLFWSLGAIERRIRPTSPSLRRTSR